VQETIDASYQVSLPLAEGFLTDTHRFFSDCRSPQEASSVSSSSKLVIFRSCPVVFITISPDVKVDVPLVGHCFLGLDLAE
jgi:hypothetical protein